MMNAKLEMKLKNLPSNPGVYLFKNREGKIIYIGKAKSLRNRVRTYFQSPRHLDPKTSRLIGSVDDMDLMVTDSEIEALILEANLVKEHKPHYNVNLKDDKHFPYVKITVNEPYPRVLVVRRLADDGARYFGPYTSAKSMRRTLHFLCALFKIRTCNLTIPHPAGRAYKVCLDYHIGRCGGPCEGLQTEKDYRRQVDSVIMFLSGKSEILIQSLNKRMERKSQQMKFEEAAEIRDQIDALQEVWRKQKVDAGKMVSRDIVAFAREERETAVVVLQIRDGVLIGRQDFQLNSDSEEKDEEIIAEFVKQYYNHQPNLPRELYLPLKLTEEKLICRWLSRNQKQKVRIFTPLKGEKVKLVDMAAANARLLLDEVLIQKRGFKERVSQAVQILKEDLHLEHLPRTIACVDISNTGETDAVGSLVYFENGKPKKSGYRHFKIKGVQGQNDFAMMREVVGRYFFRLKEEKGEAPNLLMVDGGKGQLSSVLAEIKSLGFENLSIIGLAKKFEEIYLAGHSEPVTISKSSPGLRLLKQVRDEAHRFAIEYNRKVRSARTIKSELDELAGIGPKRREILLKHFGSMQRVKEATIEELQGIKGIPKSIAEKIFRMSH